jgi:hypothetical protein
MNSMANTISLMARHASINLRTGCSTQRGARLCADISPNGTAQTMASTVPHSATAIVTHISCA